MSIVITRLFDTYEHASQAVAELEASGIPHADISLVGNSVEAQHDLPEYATTGHATTGHATTGHATADAGSGGGAGATIGTVLGGGAGLLAGLGMLAIPGVGPVVAAGWLVATAVGAGVGAGAGGLLGSLVGAGVDETDAHVYSEGVRRGGTLITVRAEESQRPEIEQIMARFDGVDATTRGDEYRADGWERFDEGAPAYIAGETPTLGAVPTTVVAPGLTPAQLRAREPSTTLL